MTGFEIEKVEFVPDIVGGMPALHPRFTNWPVVYTIDNGRDIYVGESQDVSKRMRQHLANPEKRRLRAVRVVIDETFNRSVCHDLESTLIRWLSGDEKFAVMNRNDGITDADYYRREEYQRTFRDVFDALRADGVFERTIPQIENSDLFKLSPFKALSTEQAVAVEAIVEGLAADLEQGHRSLSIVQGDPGTGKTIVGIYLMKLLRDIGQHRDAEDPDPDSLFSEFFVEGTRELFRDLRIGLVVPQQSLRRSIQKVFAKTPALHETQVLSPFDVGASEERWDVLVVDEAHRLSQLAAQAHGTLTKKFKEISTRLFGEPLDETKTQLDWIRAQADHAILLLDTAQSVRPADIGPAAFAEVIEAARAEHRHYPLASQMRVAGGNDYIEFVRRFLSDDPPSAIPDFGGYDFRIFTDLEQMVAAIRERDREAGLSRLVAGYAWDWRSRTDPDAYDIEIGDVRLRWNSRPVDWINSPKAGEEVGSIHTVQGYDLNYAGVIIGGDLRRDPRTGRLHVDRANYRDLAGKRNNPMRGQVTTDDDLLRYITNIYAVLMTRGMRGTYVHWAGDR